MVDHENGLQGVSPAEVLKQIAKAVPESCRDKLIVIGSLAVGYHFREHLGAGMAVRTKDADCLLSPRVNAVGAGAAIADQLLDAGWRYRPTAEHTKPGTQETSDRDLPAVRLMPPGSSDWFIELLTVPESPDERTQRWLRLPTGHGHFGLCSFRFLSLLDLDPLQTDLGVQLARPEMMALANLLEHPEIGPQTMSAGFAGRPDIKRSNKDLGRVLAIARLAMACDENSLLQWPSLWREALETRFPTEWRQLGRRAGNGLTTLLASDQDLEQAHHTCVNGLLASRPPALEQLRIAGQRLMVDAVELFMEQCRGG